MPAIPGFLLGRRPSLASIQIIIRGLGQRYSVLSVRVSLFPAEIAPGCFRGKSRVAALV